MSGKAIPNHGLTRSNDYLLIISKSHSKAYNAATKIRDELRSQGVENIATKIHAIQISDLIDNRVSTFRRNTPYCLRDKLFFLRGLLNFRKTAALENLRTWLQQHFNGARGIFHTGEHGSPKYKFGIIFDSTCFKEYLREVVAMIQKWVDENAVGTVDQIFIATDGASSPRVSTSDLEKLKPAPQSQKLLELVRRLANKTKLCKKSATGKLMRFIRKNFPENSPDDFIKFFKGNFSPCVYKPQVAKRPWIDQFKPFINKFFALSI